MKIKILCKQHKTMIILIISIILANLFIYLQETVKLNPVMIAGITILFYLILTILCANREKLREKRVVCGILLLAASFSAMIVIGAKIKVESGEFLPFTLGDLLGAVFYFGVGGIIFSFLFLLSTDKAAGKKVMHARSLHFNAKRFAVYSVILIVSWLPVFLVYYPGIIPGDATNSIGMLMGDQPWTNHFPVFYTLIIGFFLKIGELVGNINLGVALYSITQLITMALAVGFMLEWLGRKELRRIWIYSCIAYFCAVPLFGNYAIVMWKDPWFSAALILLVIYLYDNVVEEPGKFLEKKQLLVYAGLVMLICLLRNNGIYIAVLISFVLLFLYRHALKKVLAGVLIPLAIVSLITGPVYQTVFSAENVFAESVGIPLQQMARTIVMDGKITAEQEEVLDEILPIEEYKNLYSPFIVDPIKWAPDFDNDYLETHKKEFLETWLGMMKDNLGEYVKQYLMGTYGFWHIGRDLEYEFVKFDIPENDWGIGQSYFFESHFGYSAQDKLNPRYDYLPSGLLVWILLWDIVMCWMKKKSIYILPLLVMAGNWITLLVATPIAFGIRYLFVCVIGLPILLAYPWLVGGRTDNEKCTLFDRKNDDFPATPMVIIEK